MQKWGPEYRQHAAFQPAGANINFVEVLGENKLKVRTYERGVENETLSCGTGCVASAYLAHLKQRTRYPTEIMTRGGKLKVSKDPHDEHFYLEGEVKPPSSNSLSLTIPRVSCKSRALGILSFTQAPSTSAS